MGTAAAFRSAGSNPRLENGTRRRYTKSTGRLKNPSKSGLFRWLRSSPFLGTIALLTRILGIRFSTPRPGYACFSAACATLDAAAYARLRSGPPGAHSIWNRGRHRYRQLCLCGDERRDDGSCRHRHRANPTGGVRLRSSATLIVISYCRASRTAGLSGFSPGCVSQISSISVAPDGGG